MIPPLEGPAGVEELLLQEAWYLLNQAVLAVELVLPEEPLKAEELAMTSPPRRGHHSAPDEGYLRPFFHLSAGWGPGNWQCTV